MTRLRNGSMAVLLMFVLLHAPAAAATAPTPPEALIDSTIVEHWTLDNGLRVTTRSASWAKAVAITVAYGVGSDDDPAGRDGLAQTLADLQFTSATADVPERSRDELDSQRPFGWSFNATRKMTLMTEVAAPKQFPGVLSQVAGRMRGVKVTREGLRLAIQNAHELAQEQVYGPPSTSLFYLTREAARRRTMEMMAKHAELKDLDRLTLAQAQEELGHRFVPTNASLAIAGNLGGLDVQKLVENLFGGIPAGTPFPRASGDSLHSGAYIIQFPRPGLPSWSVGVLAPALSDSLHPSFYLSSLVLSSYFDEIWRGQTEPNSPTRFFYALLDEPDLVRVMPPPDSKNATIEALAFLMQGSIAGLYREVITQDDYDALRRTYVWIVGGAMDGPMRDIAKTQAAPWHTLARTMAVRELRGGPEFWADYRRRFERMKVGGLEKWANYYADGAHQVRLLLIPSLR